MTSQELGAVFLLLCYLALFVGAVRVFGPKRVLLFLLGIVVLGVIVAFKTLGVITGGRRY